MKFCDRLKKLRSERGVSQEKLSRELKEFSGVEVSQQRINHYENENNEPDHYMLMTLADFFQVSVDYLIGHSNVRMPLKDYELYKLAPAERAIIDVIRSFPDEYTAALQQLLEATQKMK